MRERQRKQTQQICSRGDERRTMCGCGFLSMGVGGLPSKSRARRGGSHRPSSSSSASPTHPLRVNWVEWIVAEIIELWIVLMVLIASGLQFVDDCAVCADVPSSSFVRHRQRRKAAYSNLSPSIPSSSAAAVLQVMLSKVNNATTAIARFRMAEESWRRRRQC